MTSRTYEIQMCGDEWYSAGAISKAGRPLIAAHEIRLWEVTFCQECDVPHTRITGDEPLAVAVYDKAEDGWSADGGDSVWYGWTSALRHATRNHPDAGAISAWLYDNR